MTSDSNPKVGVIVGGIFAAVFYQFDVWWSFDIQNPVALFPGFFAGSLVGAYLGVRGARHAPNGASVWYAFTPIFLGLVLATPYYVWRRGQPSDANPTTVDAIAVLHLMLLPVAFGLAMLSRWAARRGLKDIAEPTPPT